MRALCYERAWKVVVMQGHTKSIYNVDGMATYTQEWQKATLNTIDASSPFLSFSYPFDLEICSFNYSHGKS